MNQNLKIYFTSDVHGYFFSTSYASREEQNRGLLKCASSFKKDGNTLVMDAGDILQGSAYTYYCQSELKSNESIADIMNQCGYDVITFGNHDFNYGTEYLCQYVDRLTADAVCQNVKDLEGNSLYPYVIKTLENGLRVGVVGIVTDYVNIWEKASNISDIQIVAPLEEAKKALAEVRDKVDVTVCLYHGGFERDLTSKKLLSETTENVAYRICEELDFDLLLTGHQHMSIEGQYVNGTYVVQPKENATEFHEILVEKTDSNLCISSKVCRPDAKSICKTTEELKAIEADVQDWLDSVVGKLNKPLLPDEKIKMASNGNTIADFINTIQLHYSGAMVSAVSLANEIKGFNQSVTRRDIIATYPYPNTLVVFEMTGKQLREAVERSAEYFAMNENGVLSISKDFLEPKIEHYNYDYYMGIMYQIDPLRACGSRAVKFKYQGNDVQDEEILTVCVNNYRASGAGDYPMYSQCRVVKEINVEMVELIMQYFEEQKDAVIEISEPV
ncbi:MAG TPA: bifunctional metallophosphatase/5'-nucleotidase, partial [Lachnospiraceae bacterium]|nr:bifunctional metallophosphatase/5'-nucleotidase [Lachnospiraceae bacterium]